MAPRSPPWLLTVNRALWASLAGPDALVDRAFDRHEGLSSHSALRAAPSGLLSQRAPSSLLVRPGNVADSSSAERCEEYYYLTT